MLQVRRPHQLTAVAPEQRWLIEDLWGEQAVGILGGEPKCCKSLLALEMAVSVASRTPCLGRFLPRNPGTVLLFAAEDSLTMVRSRLEALARAHQVDFEKLDIAVITEHCLRIDQQRYRQQLRDTVAAWMPRLLVLDPFVRLHRIDENAVAEVAPLLAYLRELQRQHQTAVLLVHHARKSGAHLRAGQALRGSSELHAWGDSNLYIRRNNRSLVLTIEHRAAPCPEPLQLELLADSDSIRFRLREPEPVDEPTSRTTPTERVRTALAHFDTPVSLRKLRPLCQLRTSRLSETLAALTRSGEVIRSSEGFLLVSSESLAHGEPQDLHGG